MMPGTSRERAATADASGYLTPLLPAIPCALVRLHSRDIYEVVCGTLPWRSANALLPLLKNSWRAEALSTRRSDPPA
jgi:hypothetical protein